MPPGHCTNVVIKGSSVKISTFCAISALAFLSVPAAVAAQSDGAAKEQPVISAETPKKEKKVCVREAGTGSIMVKRVCYTKAQADSIRDSTAKSLDAMNRSNSSGAGSN